jgi:small subunit ribosomal protein S17e
MGRVRNTFIKRNTAELIEKFGDKFTNDFEKNKEVLQGLVKTNSKKIRNRIAGYITFIKKKGISLKKVE